MLRDGVNMVRIEGVMGGGHCAPHPLPNEGSQAISLGVMSSTGDRWPRILTIFAILMVTLLIFFNTFPLT